MAGLKPRKANFLDIDESILESRLLVNGSDGASSNNDDVLGSLIGTSSASRKGKILTPTEKQEYSQAKFILPTSGICIKTRDESQKCKFFLNLCHSEDVMEPNFDMNDQQLAEILDRGTDDQVDDIRIPMSIGEVHRDRDKSGAECPACDVIINSQFYEQRVMKSEMHRTFLLTIALEGVEEKHKLTLDKNNYTILHNRRCFGKLNPQFVRQKPSIREFKGDSATSTTSSLVKEVKQRPQTLVQEVSAKDSSLEYSITQLSGELARVEVKLREMRQPEKMSVRLGADRIIVESPAGSLDIFVPLDIHQEEARAEYDPDRNVLTIDLPLITKI